MWVSSFGKGSIFAPRFVMIAFSKWVQGGQLVWLHSVYINRQLIVTITTQSASAHTEQVWHSLHHEMIYVALPLTTARCQSEITRVISAAWEMLQLCGDPSQNLGYSVQRKQSNDFESKQNTVNVDSLWSSHEENSLLHLLVEHDERSRIYATFTQWRSGL